MVVADSRAPRDGKFLEQVGFYNPHGEQPEIRVDLEPALRWLGEGAQPSDTVKSLLKHSGVWALWSKKRAGEDISGMEPTPVPFKASKKKLGPKAQARLEAENAPAEEAAE
jgi:small subunit ribosomal protein S16